MQDIYENKKEILSNFNIMVINSIDNKFMDRIYEINDGDYYRYMKVDDYMLFFNFMHYHKNRDPLEINEFINMWFNKFKVCATGDIKCTKYKLMKMM